MADTQAVAGLLNEVMQQDDEGPIEELMQPEPTRREPHKTPSSDERFPGLPDRYHRLLESLLGRDSWPRSDFDRLVRDQGQMPMATIERINEWAAESLDDALIEEGDPVVIHRCLIRETL
jgi:hypothetical protein